jgi:5-hydroxyisourate hydrolase
MTKLTTHALDNYSGKPAKGMKVDVYFVSEKREKIKSVVLNNDGRPDDVLIEPIKSGSSELVFHVGEYFKKIVELQNPNFLNEVSIKFGVSDPNEKYHVPLLVSPWSYSTYRGS